MGCEQAEAGPQDHAAQLAIRLCWVWGLVSRGPDAASRSSR